MRAKYYRYFNPNIGERFFKVIEHEPVMQIIKSVQQKKGRPYQKGINFLRYISFIGSWGWKIKESKKINEIKKSEFDKVLKKMILTINKY